MTREGVAARGPLLPSRWTWLYAPAQPVALAAVLPVDPRARPALLESAGLACATADTSRRKRRR